MVRLLPKFPSVGKAFNTELLLEEIRKEIDKKDFSLYTFFLGYIHKGKYYDFSNYSKSKKSEIPLSVPEPRLTILLTSTKWF